MFILFFLFFVLCYIRSDRPLAVLNLYSSLTGIAFCCLLQCSRWEGVNGVVGKAVLHIALKGQDVVTFC